MAARIDSVLANPLMDLEPLDPNARRGQVVHDESEPCIGFVVRQARAQTDLVACSIRLATLNDDTNFSDPHLLGRAGCAEERSKL
jgi:hypothetical protein